MKELVFVTPVSAASPEETYLNSNAEACQQETSVV